jgi:cysteine desulfurase/selenocysteine lyase
MNNSSLVYLDSAATAQKPQSVIDAVKNFYEKYNSNIHRGLYDLSQTATDLFENTRKKVADFIGADDSAEIIFTSNTTESINLVASGWAKKFLKKGDVVVLSEMEHNSNIVPWIRLREELKITLIFLSVTNDGRLDFSKIPPETKFIALTHASNVLGTINPIETLRKFAPNAKILIDAAQSIPHLPIDVKALDCDFLVFSSHKMFGPSGVGVLWGKKELLETMNPLVVGSHMVKKVTKEKALFADIPDRFEPGTRNLEGVIGLGAAIDFIQKIGIKNIQQHEKELTTSALEKLQAINGLHVFGPQDTENRLGIFSFSIGHVHPHDVAEILNRSGIAVRSGHHCAHILMQSLGVSATIRASFSIYNTKEDVDKLVIGIEEVKNVFSMK